MEGLFGCSSDVASVGDIELVGVKAHTRQQERHVFGKQRFMEFGILFVPKPRFCTNSHKSAQNLQKSAEIGDQINKIFTDPTNLQKIIQISQCFAGINAKRVRSVWEVVGNPAKNFKFY